MLLYVHIPFCTGKCLYCDFYSITANDDDIELYINAVALEAELIRNEYFGGDKVRIETVYLGGGTPSRLSAEQLAGLMDIIRENFQLDELKEFTCEVNPDTVSSDKFAILKAAGANRLSIGAQTFDDYLLAKIGRRHSSRQIYKACELARKFTNNINLDLIFGLPGQSVEDLQYDLEQTADIISAEHVSCYELTFAEGTELTKMCKRGEISACDEDTLVSMYRLAHEFLTDRTYKHYEISNYARENRQCLHNLRYWENTEYIGIGASASGYIEGVRYKNYSDIKLYCCEILQEKRLPLESSERLSLIKRAGETAMLALRRADGIDKEKFIEITSYNPFELFAPQIEKFCEQGLMETDGQTIKLTFEGFLLSNEIFRDFLL